MKNVLLVVVVVLVLVGLRDAAPEEEPPVFLKLHKVGSTTVASFLQCQRQRFGAGCCLCLETKENVRCDGHGGPWGHDVALKYPYVKKDVFEACGCAAQRLVVLRHPVERFYSMVSFFFQQPYLRSKPSRESTRLRESFLHQPQAVTPEMALRMASDFRKHFPTWGRGAHFRYGQLMFPVRLPEYETTFRDVGAGNVTDWDHHLAAQGLVVGVTEAMRESLALFAVALGWDENPDVLCLPVANMRRKRKARGTYNASVRVALEDLFSDEVTVYDAARRIHETQVTKNRERVDALLSKAEANEPRCTKRRTIVAATHRALFRQLRTPDFQQHAMFSVCDAMASLAQLNDTQLTSTLERGNLTEDLATISAADNRRRRRQRHSSTNSTRHGGDIRLRRQRRHRGGDSIIIIN